MQSEVIQAEGRSEVQHPPPRSNRRILAILPYLLAVLFALASLRGLGEGCITDTDAARHFLNGAFIHDLIANGQLMHPIAYGREYYSHLPALSLPYHPPVFPGIEALLFFVFGVKLTVARAAVAIAVGISAFFFYRLLRATHGSDALAACATIAVFSSRIAIIVSTDVMLEFPAFAFTMAALYCLRDFNRGYPLSRALLFAALAATAIWTKQFAVFLGAVPPVYAFVQRRWRVLFSKAMIISTALFGCAVIALVALSQLVHGTGVNQVPNESGALLYMIRWDLNFYGAFLLRGMTGISGILLLAGVVSLVWFFRMFGWRDLNLGLYVVWGVTAAGVLLLVAPDTRYIFNVLPAFMTIGFVLVFRMSAALLGRRLAWVLPAVLAAVCLGAGLSHRPEFLRGPATAASVVVGRTPGRVVYLGDADGNFSAAVRLLDANLRTAVIQGEKLAPETLQPAAFETFCRRYGIDWVVIEDTPAPEMAKKRSRWANLLATPAPSMKLERSIPLDSTRTRWRGSLEVYRFTAPSANPDTLTVPLWRIPETVQVKGS